MNTSIASQRSIVSLALINGVSWFALALFAFFTTTVIYRITGAATYGVWATILALRNATLWLEGGLAMGVTRDAALINSDSSANERIQTAQFAFRAIAVVVLAIGTLGSWVPGALLGLSGDLGREAQWLTVLVALDASVMLASSPITAVLRGRQRFDLLGIGSVTNAIVGAVAVLLGAAAGGVIGVAAALVLVRAGVSAGYALAVSRIDAALLLARSSRAAARRILSFAAPLWLVSFGTILGQISDVPVVGWFFGPLSAGHFALGAIAPSVLAGALWLLIDTIYPRLVVVTYRGLQYLRLLVLVATFLGALSLSTMALAGGSLLRLWVGTDPPLSDQVMAIYALTWTLNMPVHVLSIAAIARDQHRVVAPIVLVEALANLVLSVLLAGAVGPVGPALATLATLAISNAIIVPIVLTRRLRFSLLAFSNATLVGVIGGAVAGAGTWWLAISASPSDAVRVAIAIAIPTGIALLGAYLWIRDQSIVYRLTGLVLDWGIGEIVREALEAKSARRRLASIRRGDDLVVADPYPLVTVRIATYNRGPLVAERAIASAIKQTHKNLEILVVGDHCDEATADAVRSVSDPRVVFHNLPERGRYPSDPARNWMVAGAAPMNWALQHAKGAWIAPLDDDDEFSPDHVEVLLKAAMAAAADFAYGIADAEDEFGQWRRIGSWPPMHGGIVHAAVLYRADLRFFEHNPNAWRLQEPGDWNLWKRMRRAGVRMTFVERVVVRHYREKRALIDPDNVIRLGQEAPAAL